MAPMTEEVVRLRLRSMFAGNEQLVDEYIARYGLAIDIIKVKTLRAGDATSLKSEKENPVFEVLVRCPACYRTDIPVYELRAKSQAVVFDRFQMPIYQGSAKYYVVDYNRLAVTICPQCLFASPDKRDFIGRDPARGMEIPPRLHQGDLAAVLAAADMRQALLAESRIPASDLFTQNRSAAAGILAYHLANERARIEVRRNIAFSVFKIGAYSLKQGLMARMDNLDEKPYYAAALDAFKQCFERSNAPGIQYEGQVLYWILALSVRLGDLQTGGNYLGVLDRIKSELVSSPESTTFLQWYSRARDLWSDRENPDLWKLPTAPSDIQAAPTPPPAATPR